MLPLSSTWREETGAMSHPEYIACIVSFDVEYESPELSIAARKADWISLNLLRRSSKWLDEKVERRWLQESEIWTHHRWAKTARRDSFNPLRASKEGWRGFLDYTLVLQLKKNMRCCPNQQVVQLIRPEDDDISTILPISRIFLMQLCIQEKNQYWRSESRFEILLCPASLATSKISARGFICDVPETCLFGSCKLSSASATREPRLWKEAVQPGIANEQFLPKIWFCGICAIKWNGLRAVNKAKQILGTDRMSLSKYGLEYSWIKGSGKGSIRMQLRLIPAVPCVARCLDPTMNLQMDA